MYDIIQQTPLYQSWTRQALEEGLKEGKQQGKLEAMRQVLVNIVQARFPRLVNLAKTQAARIDDPDVLEGLIMKVSTAAKAQEVRCLLLGEEEDK